MYFLKTEIKLSLEAKMKKIFFGIILFFAMSYSSVILSAGSTSCSNYSNGICTYTKNSAI